METLHDEEARAEATRQAMAADGVPTTESAQVDYFGFDETHKVMLPDGKSWIEHRTLNEGNRRKYLNAVNRDVRIDKVKGDAILKMAPGEERKQLLIAAIIGWNLVKDGSPLAFDKRALEEFLDKAPPKIIDIIEKDVRLKNGWLQAEMTVEDIEQEIANLEEVLAKKKEDEEGKERS